MNSVRMRRAVVLLAAALAAVASVTAGLARSDEVVQPLVAPSGRGSVALLMGGSFGSANVLALDAKGRVLASGDGDGVVSQLSLCPGGRRFAEFVEFGTAETVRRFELVIRERRTLRLLRRQRLRPRDVGVIQCLNPSGEQLVVFTSGGPDSPTGRLVRMTPTKSRTFWKGTAYYASLTPTVAYVQILDRAATTVLAVDLRTEKTTKVGTVPIFDVFQLVLNNAATRLGGASYHEAGACCPRLVVIDLTRRPISLRAIPLPTEIGPSRWLGDDMIAFFGNDTMFVYDTALRLVTRVANWRSLQAAAVGSTVFGVRSDGTLVSVKLPSSRVRVVGHLPGSAEVVIATRR